MYVRVRVCVCAFRSWVVFVSYPREKTKGNEDSTHRTDTLPELEDKNENNNNNTPNAVIITRTAATTTVRMNQTPILTATSTSNASKKTTK